MRTNILNELIQTFFSLTPNEREVVLKQIKTLPLLR